MLGEVSDIGKAYPQPVLFKPFLFAFQNTLSKESAQKKNSRTRAYISSAVAFSPLTLSQS